MKLYLHTWMTFAPVGAVCFHAQMFLCSKQQGQNKDKIRGLAVAPLKETALRQFA